LEKKLASLLLTCFPRPAGFLRQKALYQLILPKSNIFLHFSGAISWLSGWIYAFDLR
jgi:hypothetical protein